MKRNRISLKLKRRLTLSVHCLFFLSVITGICLLFTNLNYGRGISWIFNETYVESSFFSKQLQSDINHIINYVRYRDSFETNGKIDLSRVIINASESPGEGMDFTVEQMLQYGKDYGYSLAEDWSVKREPSSVTDDEQTKYLVNYRSYAPDYQPTEPGTGYFTIEELAEEMIYCLGEYSYTYYNMVENPGNLLFSLTYTDEDEKKTATYSNASGYSMTDLRSRGAYLYLDSSSLMGEGNLSSFHNYTASLVEEENPFEGGSYTMILSLDTTYTSPDIYQKEADWFTKIQENSMAGLFFLAIGISGCLISLFYLVLLTEQQNKAQKEPFLYYIDSLTPEVSLLLCFGACLFFSYLGKAIGDHLLHLIIPDTYWEFSSQLLQYSIIYFVCMVEFFSLLRRYYAKTLLQNSLIQKTAAEFQRYIVEHRFSTRFAIYCLSFLGFNLISIIGGCILYITSEAIIYRIIFWLFLVIWILVNFFCFHLVIRKENQKDLLNEAISNISAGDTTYTVDVEQFTGKERVIAENINNIGIGLDSALQHQVKSERLKADLITNVSHDLKTPLTSIINYVDLIKRENIQDEKVQKYLDVLEQKSQRLKTLTEDLVEASKASSGNVKLDMMDIDFVELVYQTNGEFEEKFALRHLELVTSLPETSLIIQADGRRLWRVLENLYNNAFKYAMEHSRIYVDMKQEGDFAVFTIKNISENALNINGDELTERFVRGDVSRTTEGSGLGLSIAKNLTQLQKGTFEIVIDGDLFKVYVKFPLKPKEVPDGKATVQ